VREEDEGGFAPGEPTLVKGAFNPNFKSQSSKVKSLKERSNMKKNLMAKKKRKI